ncbi:MAG: hypothetical protein QXF76_00250 [Candidatus Anstonellales archaeon]
MTYNKEKITLFISNNKEFFKKLDNAGFSGLITFKNYLFCFYYPLNRFDKEKALEKINNSLKNNSLFEVINSINRLEL